MVGILLLKSLIDAYQIVSTEVYAYFAANAVSFPLDELRRFLSKQFLESGCLLYVHSNLSLDEGSLRQIISVSEKYNFACEMIESDLKALIYFVLQVLGDIGPGAESLEAETKTLSVGCLMYQKQKINNKFWIDSLSAFKEYCRYRPALVSKVVTNPKMETS